MRLNKGSLIAAFVLALYEEMTLLRGKYETAVSNAMEREMEIAV